ncbi:MAG: hypothetical protein ACLRYY_10195 [Anaerobutyricum soehngenii]
MIELLCSPDGLNISHRNITVVLLSGVVPKIYEFADRNPQVTLAISLHSPNDTMRRELMPIANKYSMDELMEAARYYTRTTGRRITFEYSLVKGVNDKKEHAQELISRVKGMNCHINLIPVNPIKERDFEQSTQNNVAAFKHILERQHIQVTVRREMGRDIQAACGQLRKSYEKKGVGTNEIFRAIERTSERKRRVNQDHILFFSDEPGRDAFRTPLYCSGRRRVDIKVRRQSVILCSPTDLLDPVQEREAKSFFLSLLAERASQ